MRSFAADDGAEEGEVVGHGAVPHLTHARRVTHFAMRKALVTSSVIYRHTCPLLPALSRKCSRRAEANGPGKPAKCL